MKQETPLKLICLKPLFCDLYSAKRSHTEHNYSQDSSINMCVCVCVCAHAHVLHILFVGQTYQDWWWCDNILFGRQVPVFQKNTIPSRWKQNIPLSVGTYVQKSHGITSLKTITLIVTTMRASDVTNKHILNW